MMGSPRLPPLCVTPQSNLQGWYVDEDLVAGTMLPKLRWQFNGCEDRQGAVRWTVGENVWHQGAR